MPIDRAGNKRNKAASLGAISGFTTRKDGIGGTDRNDFYRLTLSSRSSLSLSLGRLKANADLYLLSKIGQVLQKSTRKGKSSESIATSLEAGTYFIRVQSRDRKTTQYSLGLSSTLTPPTPIPSITVTDPNGGNSLTKGNGYFLYWNDNIGENVRVDLFKGGSYFSSITSSTLSNGSYYWSVPNTLANSSDYQIRVSSTLNGNVQDYSNAYFTIAAPSTTVIDSGSGNNPPPGNIYPTVDLLGASFAVVESSLTSGSSSTANFRVQNIGNSGASNFRVGFYLSKDNSINTGDRSLGYYDISSLAANTTTGTLTASLVLPSASDGFWNMGSSNNYYIGMVVDALNVITESSEANNASVGSGTDFASKTITAPIVTDFDFGNIDAGTSSGYWAAEWLTSQKASYFSRFKFNGVGDLNLALGNLTGNADISLIYDGNNNGLIENGEIVATSANLGSLPENINRSNQPAGTYFVKVYPATSDISTFFRLDLALAASEPPVSNNLSLTTFNFGTINPGENYSYWYDWSVGDTNINDLMKITFAGTASLDLRLSNLGDDADVRLIYDGNNNGLIDTGEVIANSINRGSETEIINRTGLPAGNYYIDISRYNTVSYTPYRLDISGSVDTSASIAVITPNGTNTLSPGSNYNITWNDNIGENVKIDLYRGGTYYSTINSSTVSDGTESWAVPTTLPNGSNYKLRISSTANPNLYDESDATFTIAPYIIVTSPDGGNSLTTGSNYNVTWNDNISENVKIDLYKGGAFHSTIANSTLSDGSETWVIPNSLSGGSDYQLRISSTTNSSLFDASNSYLTITPSYITVSTPNGGNSLTKGTGHYIYWDDNLADTVRLDLYKGGSLVSNIATTAANNGYYYWSPSNTLTDGSDYQIKLSATNNSGLYDFSDSYFSIAASLPTLTLIANDSSAAEPNDSGQFAISRSGSTGNALTVYYTFGGTATNSVDYSSLTGNIVIPAGQSSITLPITVIDDILPEGSETVSINLSANSAYALGNTTSAVVTIGDNEPTAYDLGSLNGTRVISDSINSTNSNDYYRFNLTSNRSFSSLLNGLFADLNIQLLDSNGIVLQSPTSYGSQVGTNTGTTLEATSRLLNAGTYYIRVYAGTFGANTSYNLALLDTSALTTYTDRAVELTNFYRTQSGLNALTKNTQLTTAAQAHSQDMALNDFYSHIGFNGSTFGQRITAAGYQWTSAAENIYASPSTPEAAMEGWMFSTEHRNNILNGNSKDIGVGYYYLSNDSGSVNGNYYWTQNFGTSLAIPDPKITVTSPDGGDTLQTGSSYNVTWIDNIAEDIKIDLYKGGSFNRTIANFTASDGSYLWTVPSTLVGTDYQIRVTSVNNANFYDTSNSNFTIRADLKKYWFHYNFNPGNYLQADSYSGSIVAPAGMYTVAALDGSYVDSDFFDPGTNFTETGLNGKYLVFGVEDVDDNSVGEAGKVYVHNYADRDNGIEQNFIPYKYSVRQPSGTNYLGSEIDYIDPTQSNQTLFGQEYYEADPEASNWRAEFFNNTTLTGTSPFIDSFGSGLSFNRQWGTSSPSARNNPATVLSDGFSTRISSTRYLAPGLYQIKTTSDDGVRVNVNGQRVIDAWYDQGSTPPHSGFFYWVGGNAPITVEYYDNTGSAGIAFELKAATAFTDTNLDASTRWLTDVFTWNPNQLTPASDFYTNSNNRIGVIDQGSNTRGDSKKGISFNLGKGALLNDPNRLPDDLFVVRSYTWADFDGTPYKFHASGDDGYQILAKNQSTQQWYYITPKDQWQNGTQDRQVSLPAGRYDLHYHYFENGGDAAFDLSWERSSKPDIDIQESFVGNFGSKEGAIRQAVSNWETIITQHQSQNGLINMTFTFNSNFNWNGSYGYTSPNDSIDDNNSTIYLNPALLNQSDGFIIRLVMHEIGHTIGLGNTLNPNNPNDNTWHGDISGNPYTQGLMNYSCLPGTATENTLMYNELQALGYQFNRFGISSAGGVY